MTGNSGYRKIDAHVHILCNKAPAVDVLDRLNTKHVVNISYSRLGAPVEIERFEVDLQSGAEALPERFLFCPSFNVTQFEQPDYAPKVIEKLRRDFSVNHAVAVKIWKDVGMLLTDKHGRHIFCDDDRFKPIFAWLNGRRAVVYVHTADPIAAWRPLDPSTPRGEYYAAHSEFYCYDKPGRPSHEELMEHRDALVEAWPDIRFVCAHLASLDHDIEGIGAFLDAHPNCQVDVAARDVDLMQQPDEEVRNFFKRYQDRILWGSDWSPTANLFRQDPSTWPGKIDRLVESFEQRFNYFEERLGLPEMILNKFYFRNSATMLGIFE